MRQRAMSRYRARGKFGEQERGVRVAGGAAESTSSLLRAQQTSEISNTKTTSVLIPYKALFNVICKFTTQHLGECSSVQYV